MEDGDWITARYLLSSALGRNALVVDYVDEESFPVDDDPPTSPSSSSSSSSAAAAAGARRAEAPPPVRAPAGVAGTVCAVCTEEIGAAEAVARLPCAHWYHHACIAPWLGIRATCPMCRAELPPAAEPDGEDEAGGEGGAKPTTHAAGTSAAAVARATATVTAAAARVRRDASYEYLAVAGGVVSG